MVVCLCVGTSDEAVRAAIERGATTVGDIGRGCGAGRDCGACVQYLRRMLAEAARSKGETAAAGVGA